MKATKLTLTVDTTELDAALAKAKELEATLDRIAAKRQPYVQPYIAPIYPQWGPYSPIHWVTSTTSGANGITYNGFEDWNSPEDEVYDK